MAMRSEADAAVPITLTREQARDRFDEQARRRLGISGEEFLRRWDAGYYKDPDSDPNVISMVMLVPLVR